MCHKTASLVANALESTGIATVIIGTLRKPLENAPRALITPFVNAPIGPPGEKRVQLSVVESALRLLTSASTPTIETMRRDEAACER